MNSIEMDGKGLADRILTSLELDVKNLKREGIAPCLAVLSSYSDASKVYIRSKQKACERIGIEFRHIQIMPRALFRYLSVIDELNKDPNVHGIIVQLPIDNWPNESQYVRTILDSVNVKKDVDGLGSINTADIWTTGMPRYQPCTPEGIIRLLDEYFDIISGKHAVILGRSNLVGKPLAGMLLEKGCTVTICHSETELLMRHVSSADILVTAMGKPNVIEQLPYGIEALVDVSINRDEFGHLVGDIPKTLYSRFKYYTPVPGGVGPMTVAMLMEHVVESARTSFQ